MLAKVFKAGLGIILGYGIFFSSSTILFVLFKEKFMNLPELSFILLSTVYGIFFSLMGGFITSLMIKEKWLISTIILAVMIAVPALLSILMNGGTPIVWSAIISLGIFSPIVVFGGYLRTKIIRPTV